MSIISIDFGILMAVSLILYWGLPSRYRWLLLLAVSGIFVWSANGHSKRTILVMLVSIALAYGAASFFDDARFKDRNSLKKMVLAFALIGEAGIFVAMKGIWRTLPFAAPLGVSYFLLSLTGYMLDTYWGVQKAEKNPLKVLLFGSYFPLLTSGPIVRYGETGSELFKEHRFDYQRFCFGLQRILWGVFKKLVIAGRLSVIVDTIYENPQEYYGFYIWTALAAFTLQLYTDFSGCIDIVCGVSELFGIPLPDNFCLPFAAGNLSEFWRRWHITLGLWLKTYVLYPLLKSKPLQWIGDKARAGWGKKAGKKLPVWCGLFVSWFLIGFWHGGTWNYIVGVGLWFWLLIVLGEMLEPLFKKLIVWCKINTDCFGWHLFQAARTCILFMAGLGLFRAGSLIEGLKLYRAAICNKPNPWIFFDGSFLNLGLTTADYGILRLAVLILAAAGVIRICQGQSVRQWIRGQNLYLRWGIWIGLLLIILIYGQYGPGYDAAEFIYRGF